MKYEYKLLETVKVGNNPTVWQSTFEYWGKGECKCTKKEGKVIIQKERQPYLSDVMESWESD